MSTVSCSVVGQVKVIILLTLALRFACCSSHEWATTERTQTNKKVFKVSDVRCPLKISTSKQFKTYLPTVVTAHIERKKDMHLRTIYRQIWGFFHKAMTPRVKGLFEMNEDFFCYLFKWKIALKLIITYQVLKEKLQILKSKLNIYTYIWKRLKSPKQH